MPARTFSVSSSVSAPLPAPAASHLERPVSVTTVGGVGVPQISPEPVHIVATGTIAAIQQLGANDEPFAKAETVDVKSFQELQAEARRWERYYAHQPRRLADLLAVYYGGQHASLDARGPAAKPLVDYIRGEPGPAPSIAPATDTAD